MRKFLLAALAVVALLSLASTDSRADDSPLPAIRKEIDKKRYQKAIADSRAFLSRNPAPNERHLALEYLAYAYLKTNHYEKALPLLDELHRTSPSDVWKAWSDYAKGFGAYHTRRYDEALEILLGFAKNYPDDALSADVYRLIGAVFHKKHGVLKADFLEDSAYPAAFREWATYQLALTHYSNRDWPSALFFTDKLLRTWPKGLWAEHALYLKASIFRIKNEIVEERAALEEFIQKYPTSRYRDRFYLELAFVSVKTGDWTRAFEAWSAVQNKIPYLLQLGFSLFFIPLVLVGGLAGTTKIFFRRKNLFRRGTWRWRDLYLVTVVFFATPAILLGLFLYANAREPLLFKTLRVHPLIAALVVTDIALTFLALKILRKTYGLTNEELGLVWRGWRVNVGLPLLAVVAVGMLAGAALGLLEFVGIKLPRSFLDYAISKIFIEGGFGLAAIAIVFIGPVTEEIVFRIFFYNFFKAHTKPLFAAGASSLFFAGLHGIPILVPYFFSMGIILAWLYEKTKSAVPGMVTHALFNLLVLSFAVLTYYRPS